MDHVEGPGNNPAAIWDEGFAAGQQWAIETLIRSATDAGFDNRHPFMLAAAYLDQPHVLAAAEQTPTREAQ